MLELLGVLAAVALVFTLFLRPGATVAIILAVGVVGAGIVVSWNDIKQTQARRAADAAFQQQSAAAQPNVTQPNVTTPPGSNAHAGS